MKNGQCQFIELTKWTTQSGLTLIRSVPDAERLRLLLAESPPDPQLVCAKAGVILEASLDFLTTLYECPCPRRAGGLYPLQKFDSDSERQLAVILERESIKWFRPVRGQFQIYYRSGTGEQEYQPDFVAETSDCVYMLEPKARNQLEAPDVMAKKEAALDWCKNASDHARTYNGKPWVYLLIPHDYLNENMTLNGLKKAFH